MTLSEFETAVRGIKKIERLLKNRNNSLGKEYALALERGESPAKFRRWKIAYNKSVSHSTKLSEAITEFLIQYYDGSWSVSRSGSIKEDINQYKKVRDVILHLTKFEDLQ